ncbi:MAG TPA: ATP-binding cassette domain-containing protein, partial [Spirochaetales bacterium]|nr:ATP-binding cassette domain-containing protein [Spirochaetales bacterium]
MTILTLKQLSYTYPGASQPALSNINFIIPEGQYVAVLGANGSGKSTLARCLNGLLPPQPGSVSFMGLDPSVSTDRLTIRKNLAMVFQSPPDQIVASVVEEDVAFGLENLGVSREEMLVRVRDALSLVGLWDERGRPPRFLSSGQQQRLAVAGVVAMAPRFVVFDEATSMIDPQGRKAILDILDLLSASGTTIMHITHDMSEASRAQRVLVLNNGSLVFDGSPELLFAQPQPRLDAWSLVLPQAAIAAKSTGLPIVLSESARDFGMRLAHAKQNSRTSCVHCMHVQPSTHSPEADRDAHSPDMQTAFSMEDVSFRYLAKTASERIAVRSLSMELQQGHILSLVGLTGSGKSTVLQLMAALLFPSEGKVMHFGRDVSAKTSDP